MRYISFFICFTALFNVFSQGPIITPLKSNPVLQKNVSQTSSVKRALNDTIQLPFFDDFTSTKVYPNMAYWVDSLVYVNDHFAVSPPSYGVATFDNLDKKGRPYQGINGNAHNHSDSLTSNFINLKNYKNGLNTVNYTLSDSIYLSFFYQTQGLGDPLDISDSLVLKFKDSSGLWNTVWKVSGKSLQPFKQVFVGFNSTAYLNPDFQFRFINFGKTTGNMNQWHLDYIQLDQGRNRNDTIVEDVAINAVPVGPLQWYESMPYDHYKANPAFHNAFQHTVKIRNNYFLPTNVQYKCQVRDQNNILLADYPLSSSARNILNKSDSSENFTMFNFSTLTGKYPSMTMKYTVAPLANDITPNLYNSISSNNEYTKTVEFKNYFAYDDGSAEGGFGLDYGSLPAGPGYAAIKFQTSKSDTLRGLSIFFNRAVEDVQFKAFTLIVWQTISEPPANTTSNDVILKRVEVPSAIYTDSINGFTNFIFDTAVVLKQGTFYIGWQQNFNYLLNVGYDNNYKYAKAGGRNPNLFYNLNGYWEKVNSTITGAVMMRPLVGEPILIKNPASVQKVKYSNQIHLYPNPGNGFIQIQAEDEIQSLIIYNLSGQKLISQTGENIQNIDVSTLTDGIYFIQLKDTRNQTTTLKWIKQTL